MPPILETRYQKTVKKISILSNQFTIGAIVEGWFMQNIVLPPQSIYLEWDLDKLWDGVVIYHQLGQPDLQLIQALKNQRNKIVLLHMGDEYGEHRCTEAYETVDLILRNYYFREIFEAPELSDKLIWVPNGYKSGVGPREVTSLRLASDRRFLSSFIGWIDNARSFKNERLQFKEVATKCGSNLLMHPTPSFANGFNSGLYSAIMEYCVFSACPAGNSPETIRLYDALELGCVPISLPHEFLFSKQALGGVPFPVLDDWSQLPDFLEEFRLKFVNSKEEALQLQQASLNWWSGLKLELREKIRHRLFQLAR
jgi:hypothetical protein